MLKPSDKERQKTSPPRMHSTDPAQPMKRAAPNSNLQKERHLCVNICWICCHTNLYLNPGNLLLSNKERIKEVSCDPASVY